MTAPMGWTPPGLALIVGHVVAAIVLGLIVSTTARSLPVVLPLTVAALGAGGFFLALRQWRRSRSPFFEVGGVYVAVVALYTAYPLIGFLVNGLAYTPYSDFRLIGGSPAPDDVGIIGWYYVEHLLVFAVVYLVARGRSDAPRASPPVVGAATLVAAAFVYATIVAYFGFLSRFFDLTASTYGETYLAATRLPLPLAQLANHLGGARFVVELLILAALFGDYRRWRWVIAGWLAIVSVGALVRLGSRTEVVLLWLGAAMLYDRLVRPLRLNQLAVAAACGLVLFVSLGLLRAGSYFSEETPAYNPVFGYATEFETLFANAYHLHGLAGVDPPLDPPAGVAWADLLALVPQQLSPVIKVHPADWYVKTYFPAYAAVGGGLAFGTIPEGLLGGGLLGVAWRAALLAVVLARFHARWLARPGGLWSLLLYVWVTVSVYQAFRSTTFALLGLLVYRFLPVALAVGFLSYVLRGLPLPAAASSGPGGRVAV